MRCARLKKSTRRMLPVTNVVAMLVMLVTMFPILGAYYLTRGGESVADMATQLVAARQMVHTAARKLDAGASDANVWCAMAKRFATDAGFNICNDALQIHGGYGYIREYPIERLLRDSRVHQILEGTNEIMRVIVARHLLNTDEELR